MDRWQAIREAALARRREVVGDDPALMTGAALIDLAFRRFSIDVEDFDSDSMFGPGIVGCIMPKVPMCFIARWLPEAERAAVLAHEFGHFTLHADDRVQTKFQVRDGRRTGGQEGGYSPQELKERQADVFAREFLCPARWLGDELAAGRTPSGVARLLALPVELVMDQAVAALLTDAGGARPSRAAPSPPLSPPLDGAARWSGGHLLVQGGPGCGKTTALVARLLRLIEDGAPPSSIAVVTASDRTAGDLQRRIPAGLACELRIGTMRSLALDLARRWPAPLGRRFDPAIIDRVDALALVERAIEQTGVKPDRGTVVRTLREIAGSEAWGGARSQLGRSRSLPEPAFSEVSTAYEQALRTRNAFDASGAIRAATMLLRTVPQVQVECRTRLAEVLVDDAEDLTPAGVEFLATACGLGARLWAAGCAEVAVNRFNGSASDAMARLGRRLALTTLHLPTNRRASGVALAACEAAAAGKPRGSRRPALLPCTTGATADDEADAIAANVERARRAGIAYGDQVVLARSHLTLNRIAPRLRERGVPLVGFGDLADRPEVRAMTAALAEPADASEREDAIARRLRRWLFEEPGRLAAVAAARGGPGEQVARLVIHHVLSIAAEHDAAMHRDHAQFEERIAHAGALEQETAFRKEALDALALDAVRTLTIHASKGLEFGAVHLAGMSQGYMPVGRGTRVGRQRARSEVLDHAGNEEDALLLVALSRARTLVFLTRAERYATRRAAPSPYLVRLGRQRT